MQRGQILSYICMTVIFLFSMKTPNVIQKGIGMLSISALFIYEIKSDLT